MQTYLDRALDLSKMSLRDPEYIRIWNKLKDDVLNLSIGEKVDLYEACLSWPHNGAMLLFTILPSKD